MQVCAEQSLLGQLLWPRPAQSSPWVSCRCFSLPLPVPLCCPCSPCSVPALAGLVQPGWSCRGSAEAHGEDPRPFQQSWGGAAVAGGALGAQLSPWLAPASLTSCEQCPSTEGQAGTNPCLG